MLKILGILLLCPTLTFSQDYFKNHFGGTAGLVLNFGTHINAIGLNLKGYYTDHFFQVNASSTVYFYEKGLGERKSYWESRNAVGLVLLAGKRQMDVDFQLDGLNHQTPYNYGLGFNYLMYFDNAGTSQFSGGFSGHIRNFSMYYENDVFGGRAKDRFRTGQFYFSYRSGRFKAGIGMSIWTGETRGVVKQNVTSDKMPGGFKILEDLPYGKTSHGILYGSFVYNLGMGQTVHLKAGIDSEHIRHGIQNRLIHDLLFLPKKIKRKTPHYPRLDEFGCPVFEKEDVRKSKLYLQFGTNDNWSN